MKAIARASVSVYHAAMAHIKWAFTTAAFLLFVLAYASKGAPALVVFILVSLWLLFTGLALIAWADDMEEESDEVQD